MTKRILAVLLALTMVLSLCSFEAFAEDSAEKDLVVVWELAAPVEEIGSKTAKDLFGDQFEDFIKAINTEGAVLEFTVINSSSDGMMTNIFTNVDDWSNAYVCDSGYPTGTKTFTVAAADLMEHGGITEITNLRFQFGVYKKDEIKIALNSAEVMVPMSAEEPKEPEGTVTLAGGKSWDGFAITSADVLKDMYAAIKEYIGKEGYMLELKASDNITIGTNSVQGAWIQPDPTTSITLNLAGISINEYSKFVNPSDSDVTLEWAIIEKTCDHANAVLSDNNDGTHSALCPDCWTYVTYNEPHKYVDGRCACGLRDASLNKTLALITDGVGLTGDEFKGPTIDMSKKAIDTTCDEWAEFKKALKDADAKFILTYTISGTTAENENNWVNFFLSGAGNVPNWGEAAADFVDTLDGEVMPNQWALLNPGKHVVTYSLAKWQEVLAAAGVSEITSVGFQTGFDSKDLSMSIESLTVEYQADEEKKPEGYTVEVVKSEKTVEGNVITADVSAGNVQTDGLLVSFENGAPTAGTVKVIYEGEETSGGDAPATYEEVPSLAADKFAADRLDSDGVITFNAAWSDCPSIWIGEGSDITGYDSIELVIDSVSNYTQFQVQYTDGETQNVVIGFGSAGTYTADLDPTKTILQVYVQGGTEGGTVKISSIKFKKAPVADPDANAVTVEFEEGQKYVEITGLDSSKKIKAVQITFEEGAEITADVLTKIEAKAVGGSSGLPPFFPNQFYPGDGYVVTLDDQFHAFSFNGVLIPLYHEFNAAGFCTICGYYKAPAAADEVVVTTPTEPGDQDSQEEVDEPGDDITVDDTEETKEENPKTGLSLAVLPMILAAAAVVTGRKH